MQAPSEIKPKTGNGGEDVYTVPGSGKKKNGSAPKDIPLYSTVDKSKKPHDKSKKPQLVRIFNLMRTFRFYTL